MTKFLTLLAGCFIFIACNNSKPADTAATTTDSVAAAKPTPQSEFSDEKYSDIARKGSAQLSSGDIDGWMASFADNAKFRWSSGDSLNGKTAIADYWKSRRSKVIDSLNFSNDIYLSIKVNKPQKGPDRVGNWVLSWAFVNVKYKNGKKLMFWVHSDLHFDSNDKIDDYIQYLDRAPINKALGVK